VDRIPRKYIGGRLKTNPRERKGELNLRFKGGSIHPPDPE
jgi:hypothetical protein